jgi:hypothetical protein
MDFLRAGVVVLSIACASGSAFAAAAPAAPATKPAAPGVRPAAPATLPAGAATRPATQPATRPVAVKPGGPEPLPTMDELKEMLEQAKYQDLLRQLPRVTMLRGKAAEPYNKYDLWMLKFETHMRLKQQQAAISDLNEAQKMTDDPKRINYCKSVALLIKQSKNFMYQPSPQKKEKPSPIEIIDPEKRKLALKAMLDDEMAVIVPKVEKALDGTSLSNIADALKTLQGVDVLESGADAGDDASKMVADLRARGNAIFAKTVIRLTARTDEISRTANELYRQEVTVPGVGGTFTTEYRMKKRGLDAAAWRELNDIMKTTDQLIPNIKGLAEATGGKMKDVEDLINAADDLRHKADKTLKANYNE